MRPNRAMLAVFVLVVLGSLIAACSTTGSIPPIQRGHGNIIKQLKTPAITPAPLVYQTSYPMPEAFDPNEYLSGIHLGSDDNIWASLYDSNQIAQFTPAGSSVAFALPTQAPPCLLPGCSTGPTDMTLGPDGNIYVSEAQGNAIAQITPSGAATVFPLDPNVFPMLPQDEGPRGIAIGPDRDIWFVHSNSSKIGRMTTSGTVINVYSMPTQNSGGGRIVAGPDGNMWFTETANGKIGRVNVATGTVDEFSTPTANSYPHSIAVGGDGNIWFTERDANQIGRITPAGVITEFSTPSTISRPLYITEDQNGILWFAEYARDGICRLDPVALTFVEYNNPAGMLVRGLAMGLSRSIWATDDNNDAVALFAPGGPTSVRRLVEVHHRGVQR